MKLCFVAVGVAGCQVGEEDYEGEEAVREDEAGEGAVVALVEEEDGGTFAGVAKRGVVFEAEVVVFGRDEGFAYVEF